MKALTVVALLLAACAESQTTPKFWRKHPKVCVAIDGAQTLLNIRKVAATGITVNANDLPPSYKMMNDKLIIWPDEDDVPAGTSYQYMTPYQAIHAAYSIDGPGGACIAKGSTCDSWLSGLDVNALDAELKKDGLPDLPFTLVRKPG